MLLAMSVGIRDDMPSTAHSSVVLFCLSLRMTKQKIDLYVQVRLRSATASAQCDQSLLYAHWVAEISMYFQADRLDDARVDLSLRWAHQSNCWVCWSCLCLFELGSYVILVTA